MATVRLTASTSARSSVSSVVHRSGCKIAPRGIVRLQATGNDQGTSPSTTAPEQPQEKVVREYTAWGVKVIESNDTIVGQESEKDYWESEEFESLGKAVEKYFLPGLVVLGLVCGGIAAGTYNEGATVFIKSPTGPDASAQLVPADALPKPGSPAPALNAQ
mmetsp:Transcript_31164/g.69293  ORF Transcript_31164/g.69293 Transcript_31164/m.69293 type:complete len:161 (-) Transcript_31164:542-1024(-)|eukprot:CAMPEP_0202900882 /NCGR_PEP_ID=MMETSP1392-20130828/12090_1 /ASSEMBLY_ACC=CAM_ASM_000868 /TAXON_ID=225041 /ORGANISM="Chlamydomonas chlamydogama, Strain SAG 11-48b" /LENGTH=160 /DNA_ID=CAMNT_0049587339 /DNA_START=38 /DNA_END=520 /DNA_ORIENTATION=-